MSGAADRVKAVFERDIARHEMTVLRDDGLFRHLRFGRPGDGNMAFYLTTWPGHLAYTGDMGCYVFTRIDDMFQFFRRQEPNPQYWSEKVIGADRDGIEQFSEAAFREAVEDHVNQSLDGNEDWPQPAREALWQAIDDEVFSRLSDGEHFACTALHEFSHENWQFEDFSFRSCREYTFRFLWCCSALVWAISTYDAAKAAATTRHS